MVLMRSSHPLTGHKRLLGAQGEKIPIVASQSIQDFNRIAVEIHKISNESQSQSQAADGELTRQTGITIKFHKTQRAPSFQSNH